MQVLIVTWFFPPANTMGALRVGKFTEYLVWQGHNVRVIAADFQPPAPPLDFAPQCKVVRTSWLDINAAPKRVARFLKRQGDRGTGDRWQDGSSFAGSGGGRSKRARHWLASAYETIVNFPDKQAGWLPFAVRAGRDELEDFVPDVVFATAPPFTAALVGLRLARRAGVPFVVEMRDRWSDDPYRSINRIRGRIEQWLERRTLNAAAGIVTVSEPWAAMYARRHGKRTVTAYNGFDPADLRRAGELLGEPEYSDRLVIRHVGRIYPGRRDPTPLFRALAGLDADERAQVRVEFLGVADGIRELAERCGVSANVKCLSPVSHHEALRQQIDADIVLLLQWNDPAERGNVPGKLFEYLATRRPILGHGDPASVPASIIRARQAGVYSNEPDEVRAFLREKLQEKHRTGRLADNPEAVHAGFERKITHERLEAFLKQCATGPSQWRAEDAADVRAAETVPNVEVGGFHAECRIDSNARSGRPSAAACTGDPAHDG